MLYAHTVICAHGLIILLKWLLMNIGDSGGARSTLIEGKQTNNKDMKRCIHWSCPLFKNDFFKKLLIVVEHRQIGFHPRKALSHWDWHLENN